MKMITLLNKNQTLMVRVSWKLSPRTKNILMTTAVKRNTTGRNLNLSTIITDLPERSGVCPWTTKMNSTTSHFIVFRIIFQQFIQILLTLKMQHLSTSSIPNNRISVRKIRRHMVTWMTKVTNFIPQVRLIPKVIPLIFSLLGRSEKSQSVT